MAERLPSLYSQAMGAIPDNFLYLRVILLNKLDRQTGLSLHIIFPRMTSHPITLPLKFQEDSFH